MHQFEHFGIFRFSVMLWTNRQTDRQTDRRTGSNMLPSTHADRQVGVNNDIVVVNISAGDVKNLLSEMTDKVMTDATPKRVVKTPLSWQTESPTIQASCTSATIVGGQLSAAVSRSQQARFSTSRLCAVVSSDGVTTMIQPMAMLPTTVTAAAVAIHASAALSNNVDDDDVAFKSKSKS